MAIGKRPPRKIEGVTTFNDLTEFDYFHDFLGLCLCFFLVLSASQHAKSMFSVLGLIRQVSKMRASADTRVVIFVIFWCFDIWWALCPLRQAWSSPIRLLSHGVAEPNQPHYLHNSARYICGTHLLHAMRGPRPCAEHSAAGLRRRNNREACFGSPPADHLNGRSARKWIPIARRGCSRGAHTRRTAQLVQHDSAR